MTRKHQGPYPCIKMYTDPQDPRARESRRKHYQLNREQYYERNKVKERQIRQHILDLKNQGSCVDCGVQYPGEPWLFEFDHVRGEKKYQIGGIHKHSWKKMHEELAKCEMLCVLCHRRRTAQRAGWKATLEDMPSSVG